MGTRQARTHIVLVEVVRLAGRSESASLCVPSAPPSRETEPERPLLTNASSAAKARGKLSHQVNCIFAIPPRDARPDAHVCMQNATTRTMRDAHHTNMLDATCHMHMHMHILHGMPCPREDCLLDRLRHSIVHHPCGSCRSGSTTFARVHLRRHALNI